MTDAIPNLWPKKFSRGILTPLAVLRVQAAKFKDMTEGLLEAEVTTNWEREDLKVHSLELIAPALDSYRRVILTVRHAHPGAYPLWLRSDFLSGSVEDLRRGSPLRRMRIARGIVFRPSPSVRVTRTFHAR